MRVVEKSPAIKLVSLNMGASRLLIFIENDHEIRMGPQLGGFEASAGLL